MEINPTIRGSLPTVTLTPTTATTALTQTLSLGQKITALVIQIQAQGLATLKIDNTLLTAKTSLPLMPGQTLQLTVADKNAQQTTLQLSSPNSDQRKISQGLRQALPQQQPVAQILEHLNQITQKEPSTATHLPAPITQLAKQLVKHLTTNKDLRTPEGVKKSIQQSGNFFENTLLDLLTGKSKHPPTNDLKGNLLQLRQLLLVHQKNLALQPIKTPSPEPKTTIAATTASIKLAVSAAQPPSNITTNQPITAPPTIPSTKPTTANHLSSSLTEPGVRSPSSMVDELLKKTEGALSRIQVQQLSSVNNADQNKLVWSMEIPFTQENNINTLKLKIDKEKNNQAEDQSAPLTVLLSIDLEHLGLVQARIRLIQSRVSVVFWSETNQTVDIFREHLDALKTTLQASGLTTDHVTLHQGSPPKNIDSHPIQQSLLDINA